MPTAQAQAPRRATPEAPGRSPRLFALFRAYAPRYVAAHVHAVRLARGGYRPGSGPDLAGPLIVVLNHPSWWDPMIGLVLAGRFWPDRRHAAPIDSAGLAKYRFLERLGFFGIDPRTPAGARTFLRRSREILADPDSALWLTAQGRFADPRERPTRLKEGVGHLAHRLGAGHVLPLALEYPFWGERTCEALARFGPPLPLGPGATVPDRPATPAGWTDRLARELQAAQDALADDALSRDPARFETLLAGRAGVGGVYDAWRRLRAALRGERFDPGHGHGHGPPDATP